MDGTDSIHPHFSRDGRWSHPPPPSIIALKGKRISHDTQQQQPALCSFTTRRVGPGTGKDKAVGPFSHLNPTTRCDHPTTCGGGSETERRLWSAFTAFHRHHRLCFVASAAAAGRLGAAASSSSLL